MTQLAIGGSATLALADNGRVTVVTNGGFGSVTVTPNVGAAHTSTFGPLPYCRTFHRGLEEGGSVVIRNDSANSLDYEATNLANAGGGVNQLAYSTTVPLSYGSAAMPRTTIAGATALTIDSTSAAEGNSTLLSFVSDGANVPSISGSTALNTDFGYDSSQAGLQNFLQVVYLAGAARHQWFQPAVNTPLDLVAPTAGTATVENATATVINLVISEAADTSAAPSAASFTVGGHTVSSVAWGTSTRLDITVTPAFVNGEAARTLAYSPGTNPIKDVAGNLMAAFSGKSIVNNVGSALEAEVSAWLARVTTAGGTVSAGTQTAVNNFVVSAKASGYFSKLRRINLFCGDSAASLVPLVNTSGGTVDTNTSTTYAESTGRVGGGAAYIDTGYTPTQSTGGLSVYLRTAVTADTTTRIPIGVRDTGSTQIFRMAANSDGEGASVSGAVNGAWGGVFTAGTPQANTTGGMTAGMWHATRLSSTDSKLYKNGSQVGSMTSSVSPATPSNPVFVFANNGGGTANAFLAASSAIGAYAVDTGLTGTEAGNFYTHMQAFQTALSRNV